MVLVFTNRKGLLRSRRVERKRDSRFIASVSKWQVAEFKTVLAFAKSIYNRVPPN